MPRIAVLSMHTSPLAQPGTGDGGGMNVYVRELASSLARSGIRCDVFTRAESLDTPPSVDVEPGFQVHHVTAGPRTPVPKEQLPDLVPAFAAQVARYVEDAADRGEPFDAIHANYWLSGVAGHSIKHETGLPLVTTFHTLDRLKVESFARPTTSPADAEIDTDELLNQMRRAEGESQVMACTDAVIASCSVEAAQIEELYGTDPERIVVVPPGVDRAYFSPGDQYQARRALGLPRNEPMLLFVGRLLPMKGATLAVETLAELKRDVLRPGRSVVDPRDTGTTATSGGSFLVVVGGPSGLQGPREVADLRRIVADLGLAEDVRFVDPQPHELLSTYYRAADLCLVPSQSESFGLVALEASACGTPVVASAVGGLLTLVDHGETGFLVDRRDPRAFAEACASILREPELARHMSQRAARRARAYTWRDAAQYLTEIYERVGARALVECA